MNNYLIQKILRHCAFKYGRFVNLYKRVCNPSGAEYASFLKERKVLYAIGDNCHINLGVNFTDPKYVMLGNNVVLSDCNLIGHDGVVAMLNVAYDEKLDAVGKIEIGDNVFIGHGAIILRNVKVGNNVVIAAGSVVTKDIPDGFVVGGVPAKQIGMTTELVKKLRQETESLPWCDLIRQRQGAFDAQLEPYLLKMRLGYFYGENER